MRLLIGLVEEDHSRDSSSCSAPEVVDPTEPNFLGEARSFERREDVSQGFDQVEDGFGPLFVVFLQVVLEGVCLFRVLFAEVIVELDLAIDLMETAEELHQVEHKGHEPGEHAHLAEPLRVSLQQLERAEQVDVVEDPVNEHRDSSGQHSVNKSYSR